VQVGFSLVAKKPPARIQLGAGIEYNCDVHQGNSPNSTADNCLKTLGISFPCEWDALVFLYRHRTSLLSAERIARLIGYGKPEVGTALARLESTGLIRRSRGSQGLRMYELVAPVDSACNNCFRELMALAETRSGRLLLVKNLRSRTRGKQTKQREGLHLA